MIDPQDLKDEAEYWSRQPSVSLGRYYCLSCDSAVEDGQQLCPDCRDRTMAILEGVRIELTRGANIREQLMQTEASCLRLLRGK